MDELKPFSLWKAFWDGVWPGALGALFALLIITSWGHCTAIGHHRDNGLGVIISNDNPMMYNMGLVTHGNVMEDEKGRAYTSIDFLPYGSPTLFPEGILLCGNQAAPLMEHQMKVVVLTYERQAHTMYKGIACHELFSVTEVKQ
jgi:hypothetical protein